MIRTTLARDDINDIADDDEHERDDTNGDYDTMTDEYHDDEREMSSEMVYDRLRH